MILSPRFKWSHTVSTSSNPSTDANTVGRKINSSDRDSNVTISGQVQVKVINTLTLCFLDMEQRKELGPVQLSPILKLFSFGAERLAFKR